LPASSFLHARCGFNHAIGCYTNLSSRGGKNLEIQAHPGRLPRTQYPSKRALILRHRKKPSGISGWKVGRGLHRGQGGRRIIKEKRKPNSSLTKEIKLPAEEKKNGPPFGKGASRSIWKRVSLIQKKRGEEKQFLEQDKNSLQEIQCRILKKRLSSWKAFAT